MKQPVRLGFIGAGTWMQTYHLPTAVLLERRGEVTLAGIWNKTTSKAEHLAAEHKIERVYPSPETLFNDPKIDGVVVAVSRQIAGHFLSLGIDAKKPLLIEKPPAENSRAVQVFGEQAKSEVLVAFNRVFTPLFAMTEQALSSSVTGGRCVFHRVARADKDFVLETGVHALMTNDILFGEGLLQEVLIEEGEGPVPRWLVKVAYPEQGNILIAYDFHPWSDQAVERYIYKTDDGEVAAHFHQHYAPDDKEELLVRSAGDMHTYSTDEYGLLEQQGYMGEHMAFIEMVRKERTSAIDLLRTARVMALAEEIAYR